MSQELFFQHALLPGGWAANVRIAFAGGLITAVEEGAACAGERNSIGLPGIPNLHSHSFQRAIAGLTESRANSTDSFWTWRELMYRFALTMDPDDVEAVAMQAFVEMLEGGFCSVGEFHYLHHAPDGKPYDDVAELAVRIGAAAARTGIDLTLLPVFYAYSGFGCAPPTLEQRRFVNDIDGYAKIYERCGKISAVGVAPHSLRAVGLDELKRLEALAGGRPVHIHIAEQTREVTECLAWSGMTPVQWLLDHFDVTGNWCLVHATQASAAELARVASSRAVVGLCPITEANLGDGIFPARDYAGAYGIGSDSNVMIGVADELRMLEYSQRLFVRERNVMASEELRGTATAMYQSAVAGGAQALGVAGGLVVDAPANIVALHGDVGDPAMAQWIFCGAKSAIEAVWVRGKKCVTNGKHELADWSRSRFNAVVRKCLS